MAMTHPATIRKPSEGRRVGVVGDVYRFLTTGEETNGKYATIEAIVPPGSGPPPHIHSQEEESFFVLEGEMTFQLGEERIVAGAGTFLNMPVGSLHCFKNESGNPARMLISVAPAGLEKMFFEVGQPLADDAESAPPPTQANIEKLIEAAPRYGVEIKVPESNHHPIEDGPMEIEIIDQPIRFRLHRLSSSVDNHRYGEVGCRLMDEMWKVVKEAKLKTTGINHWVYFADDRMFVGVEVRDAEQAAIPKPLEMCECDLPRYSKHVHIGPYHELPQKWQFLNAELFARGEIVTMPSLEVYGHSCEGDDESKTENHNLDVSQTEVSIGG